MSGSEQERGKAVSERLLKALNAHDLEGQLGLFSEDYHSEQPAIQREHSADANRSGRTGQSFMRASLTSGPSSYASPSWERRSGANGSGAEPRRMGRLWTNAG